jgi:hypothetical protein
VESDDGRWIRAEAIQPEGGEGLSEDGGLSEQAGPGEEAGPGENDGWPAPVADPSAGKRWGHGGVPGFSAWAAAAVAVVAAAAGVAVGLFLIRGAPLASAVAGAAPGASASASISASASARPEQLRVALTGRVLAVSPTSITIGGAGPSVTAAVTGTTTITGRAHGIGGVKAGDEVSAELTGTADRLTATAIQDLASA